MLHKISYLILFFVFVGCQNKPTKVIEESVDVFAEQTVLVDTRNAFQFASYHIVGSINLNTADFLILKNPKTKLRIFDPDLKQTIERLARRGLSPCKKIILVSDSVASVESKKWKWLLKNLEIENVYLQTFDEFIKQNKLKPYAEPKPESPWELKLSENLQKEFIIKKAKDCFVNWSEKKCQ